MVHECIQVDQEGNAKKADQLKKEAGGAKKNKSYDMRI